MGGFIGGSCHHRFFNAWRAYTAVAVIQSVYRCKDGKNKKIYQKHKHYFDKQFKKHCQALHKSELK